MIVEGLFVYLPTIIAITIAFFVGVGVGILVIIVCFYCFFRYIPSFRQAIADAIEARRINKES